MRVAETPGSAGESGLPSALSFPGPGASTDTNTEPQGLLGPGARGPGGTRLCTSFPGCGLLDLLDTLSFHSEFMSAKIPHLNSSEEPPGLILPPHRAKRETEARRGAGLTKSQGLAVWRPWRRREDKEAGEAQARGGRSTMPVTAPLASRDSSDAGSCPPLLGSGLASPEAEPLSSRDLPLTLLTSSRLNMRTCPRGSTQQVHRRKQVVMSRREQRKAGG